MPRISPLLHTCPTHGILFFHLRLASYLGQGREKVIALDGYAALNASGERSLLNQHFGTVAACTFHESSWAAEFRAAPASSELQLPTPVPLSHFFSLSFLAAAAQTRLRMMRWLPSGPASCIFRHACQRIRQAPAQGANMRLPTTQPPSPVSYPGHFAHLCSLPR